MRDYAYAKAPKSRGALLSGARPPTSKGSLFLPIMERRADSRICRYGVFTGMRENPPRGGRSRGLKRSYERITRLSKRWKIPGEPRNYPASNAPSPASDPQSLLHPSRLTSSAGFDPAFAVIAVFALMAESIARRACSGVQSVERKDEGEGLSKRWNIPGAFRSRGVENQECAAPNRKRLAIPKTAAGVCAIIIPQANDYERLGCGAKMPASNFRKYR